MRKTKVLVGRLANEKGNQHLNTLPMKFKDTVRCLVDPMVVPLAC